MKSFFIMYFKYIHIFLLTFLFSFKLSAHNGSIEGYVYDTETKNILPGATIVLAETEMETTTNEFGKYFFNGLPSGNYTIEIFYLGYKPLTVSVAVNDGITSKIENMLEQTTISLQDVVVSPSTTNSYNTVKALDIKLRPIETSQDALRLVPGLFIAQHAGGG
ncbi:MAG: carboxypeptidase-like regulatory domain-containing protein, partial [Fimbriimonadaceae bacterium]|nr:carboxypeptidase-like regulatory domain-containing protein [Chitinophagales bacterium]